MAEAQSFSVKRAQVEFHNFASLGEPERAFRVYAEENVRRGGILRQHMQFIGPMSPFVEIGANAGHTSYLLCNEFGAEGFALDISADALRHGIALQDRWKYAKAPVRVAGDALNLPFADGSLRMVLAFQMLSQFLDLDAVFREVARVLAPGGIFLFSEEPLKRMLTLGLYRAPYVDTMKRWERTLYEQGLLGYLVKDVIGAHQEESFGIRQNHSMDLKSWQELIHRHFAKAEYQVFVRSHGWAERGMRALGRRIDRHGSDWVPARLLGGTLAAVCLKAGEPALPAVEMDQFERYLRCPDCHGAMARDANDSLRCVRCDYEAANEGGVYNVLRDVDRKELYPGDRADVIDFSLPGHETKLRCGWHDLEGVFGNKYRWIGARATAVLERVRPGKLSLRVRGHAHEHSLTLSKPVTVALKVNGEVCGQWALERNGLFVLEAAVPDAPRYEVELVASPEWCADGDSRSFTVNISMLRLVDSAS